uniref:class I SAM-dependent DNA methyltransferase n=1 Tax=Eubacterium cellulosolvens TaxID=29322 RepID=UPI000485DCCC|nr:class I SAM-dependent methyltransferase [[Eubacterium] cellulosolvens]
MSEYESFARVYDLFMDNVDYEGWSRYLTKVLKEDGIENGLICELGCGTGTMSELLAGEGYEVIGIDSSMDMLEEAQEKKYESGHDILYLNQDMREFELYGTVRAVVSVCDCLNYLLEDRDLLQVFRLVNNYLDPGGLFVFDMTTEAKYAGIGNSTIADSREDGSFIWENAYDPQTKTNEYVLTLFVPEDEDGNGLLYRRYEEVHVQKVYTAVRIRELLERAGMIFEGVFDAYTDEAPSDKSQRLTFIAREHGKVNGVSEDLNRPL